MHHLSADVVQKCKKKLLETKMDCLNRVRDSEKQLREMMDKATGDEADQSSAILTENEVLSNQERIRLLLTEVDFALSKIDRGTYGICEETDEPIEPARLLALPWTRLSIEGAEVRESIQKRFAR
jgi:DnaK suppressor protein